MKTKSYEMWAPLSEIESLKEPEPWFHLNVSKNKEVEDDVKVTITIETPERRGTISESQFEKAFSLGLESFHEDKRSLIPSNYISVGKRIEKLKQQIFGEQ